jgi:hypothetical protein
MHKDVYILEGENTIFGVLGAIHAWNALLTVIENFKDLRW